MDQRQIKRDLKRSAEMVTQDSARRFIKRATYARLNNVRWELIQKKTRLGLNKKEQQLFEILQQEVGRIVDLAWPPPDMSHIDELIEKIKQENESSDAKPRRKN